MPTIRSLRSAVLGLAAVVALSGVASGQDVDLYAGGSFGVTALPTSVGFPVELIGGAWDLLLPGLGARAELTVLLPSGTVGLGASVLYRGGISDAIDLYGGLGPRLLVANGFGLGLGLVAGAEFGLTPEVGLFAELGSDLYFSPGSIGLVGLSVGASYRF